MIQATEPGADSPTIKELLDEAIALLDSDSPRLDAEVLLAHVIQQPRSHLIAWPEKRLGESQYTQFRQLLERRRRGEPVAYLTGVREFWSLSLTVTTDTLIPRPETESLVERALEKMPLDTPLLVADLGTGSGAIALALASERPDCTVIATERDQAALSVARENARRLDITNVSFRSGHWCEPLDDLQLDLIVSNPPYIATADPHLARGDVRFEPRSALAAGPAGMDDLGAIAACASRHLKPGGWLFMEHGFDQGELTRQLLEDTGFSQVLDHSDNALLARVISGRWPG
jgi:release factor glutamine methyltransferase